MERLNNQYLRAALIGLLVFVFARITIMIIQGFLPWEIVIPNVLAAIPAVGVATWVLKHYHYE